MLYNISNYILYNILQYYQSWRDHRLMLPDNMTSEYRLLPVDNHQLFVSTSPNFHFYGLWGSWIWPNRLRQIGALLVDQWYEKSWSYFAIGGFRSKFLPDWMFDGWIICNWWFAIKMSPGWMAVRDLATRFLLQECQECDLSGRFPFNKLCNSEWCKIFMHLKMIQNNSPICNFQTMTIPNHYIWLYKNKSILYMVKWV